MGRWIALLRGVNVGGGGKLPMAELRRTAEKLGLKGPRTLLQSGNLVFDSDEDQAAIETQLEKALVDRHGFAREVMVRSPAQWEAIIKANPFPDMAEKDPSHLLVAAFKVELTAEEAAALEDLSADGELLKVVHGVSYSIYPDGIGRSKLAEALARSKVAKRSTARNWNTVLKLRAMAADGGWRV